MKLSRRQLLQGGGATLASAAAWAAVASTVWSGVEYLVAARGLLTEPEPTSREPSHGD